MSSYNGRPHKGSLPRQPEPPSALPSSRPQPEPSNSQTPPRGMERRQSQHPPVSSDWARSLPASSMSQSVRHRRPSAIRREHLEPLPSIDPLRLEAAPPSGSRALVLKSAIRLRVAGLGHYLELDPAPDVTLGDLKEEIEKRTDLPAPYQRLVAKRKKMDDDTMVLGSTIMDGNTIISMGIGLEDRTKILLLHSPSYAKDKEGIDKLTKLLEEIDKIDQGMRSGDMENKQVQELVIQMCCKIDCVETNGSEALRKMRKHTIRKAEDVASYAKDKEGIDKLTKLNEEIDKIEKGRRSRDYDNKQVQEFIIQVCCKIDCVETNGSETLRKMRKNTIRKAEEVGRKSEADKRGVDP